MQAVPAGEDARPVEPRRASWRGGAAVLALLLHVLGAMPCAAADAAAPPAAGAASAAGAAAAGASAPAGAAAGAVSAPGAAPAASAAAGAVPVVAAGPSAPASAAGTKQMRLASRFDSLPIGRSAELLAFEPFDAFGAGSRFRVALVQRRALEDAGAASVDLQKLIGDACTEAGSNAGLKPDAPSPAAASTPASASVSASAGSVSRSTPTVPDWHPIPPDQIWAEKTTQGDSGNDFRWKESTTPKTLIHFTPELWGVHSLADPRAWWRDTRVYVMNCGSDGTLRYVGWLDTQVTSVWLCRLLAVLMCVVFYALAAWATFHIHRSQREHKSEGGEAARIRHGLGGTNYASLLSHFNPVVLTAGGNGRGSATKLQILFFSVLVFGLVSYIWMSTGYLSDLSSTVLMLMGISGLGATVSAATDVSRNRLDFDDWAWLVNRRWLPRGGVAEANRAQWKDIVMTDGEFDVYRFQMVTFSVLVGMALLQAGGRAEDLSTFTIPGALLGVLGLSQAVYVAGKLAAPPAVAQLNEQIAKLRTAEAALQTALQRRDAGAATGVPATLLPRDRAELKARVGDAYDKYIEAWDTARTMFESTLSRSVSAVAEGFRPPFPYLSEPAEVLALLEKDLAAAEDRVAAAENLLAAAESAPEAKDPASDKAKALAQARRLAAGIAAARTDCDAALDASRRGVAGIAQATQALPQGGAGTQYAWAVQQDGADEDTLARERAGREQRARDALDALKRCVARLDALAEAVKKALDGGAAG